MCKSFVLRAFKDTIIIISKILTQLIHIYQSLRRQRAPVVRALSLHVVAAGSNLALTSGLDLLSVVLDQLYHAL